MRDVRARLDDLIRRSGGEVVGVLQASWPHSRMFNEDDRAALVGLAGYAAQAVRGTGAPLQPASPPDRRAEGAGP